MQPDNNSTTVDFVSLVAHELKTPLTSLKGYMSVFIEENAKNMNAEQNMFLNRMEIATQQLSSLIDNLLNASRIERGVVSLTLEEVEYISFVKAIFDEFENRAKERKIEMKFIEPTASFPKLSIDKVRITEVLLNLIANGIIYNKEGGSLTISFEVKDGNGITHIQDTGIGVSKDAIPQLFNKYYRAPNTTVNRAAGTGLGLYVAKTFVEMHKGKIWIESEPNVGSTFSFSLPVVQLNIPTQQQGQ